MKIRLPASTATRLQDAAKRHGLTMAEVTRRACRKFDRIGTVATLPQKKAATRQSSECYTLRGIPDRLDYLIPQIIDWYLDACDTGRRRPEPTIDPADLYELRKIPTTLTPTYHLRQAAAIGQ